MNTALDGLLHLTGDIGRLMQIALNVINGLIKLGMSQMSIEVSTGPPKNDGLLHSNSKEQKPSQMTSQCMLIFSFSNDKLIIGSEILENL